MASFRKNNSLRDQIEMNREPAQGRLSAETQDLSGIPTGPGLALDPLVAGFLAALPNKVDLGRLAGLNLSDPAAALSLLKQVHQDVQDQRRTASALMAMQTGDLMEHTVVQ